MARARHYSPALSPAVVSLLYHEAKARRVPMTRLANSLLSEALLEKGHPFSTSIRVNESPGTYLPRPGLHAPAASK